MSPDWTWVACQESPVVGTEWKVTVPPSRKNCTRPSTGSVWILGKARVVETRGSQMLLPRARPWSSDSRCWEFLAQHHCDAALTWLRKLPVGDYYKWWQLNISESGTFCTWVCNDLAGVPVSRVWSLWINNGLSVRKPTPTSVCSFRGGCSIPGTVKQCNEYVLSCVLPNTLKSCLICYYYYSPVCVCVCVYRHTCTMACMWRAELVFSFHFMVWLPRKLLSQLNNLQAYALRNLHCYIRGTVIHMESSQCV